MEIKNNYTQEEIVELRSNLHAYLDARIFDLSKTIDQIYKYPEWFKKIPKLRKYVEEKEDFIVGYGKIRNFLSYVQSKSIPEYLDHINTKK